jgi:hypothetical protein
MILLLSSMIGLGMHYKFDYIPRVNAVINTSSVYGILIMLHSLFGASGIVERPKRIRKFTENTFVRAFTLWLVSYASTRDIEDSIFVMVIILTLTQFLRTNDERQRHPYIL